MSGEKDLSVLLATMSPCIEEEEFVFCTMPTFQTILNLGIVPKGMFEESEGTTLILGKQKAEQASLAFIGSYRCITLNVHSSLEAVGLTAAVSRVLADVNISANVVAAYYHDHIFVPCDKAQQAMIALECLIDAQNT
jgi:uncharacterized protein